MLSGPAWRPGGVALHAQYADGLGGWGDEEASDDDDGRPQHLREWQGGRSMYDEYMNGIMHKHMARQGAARQGAACEGDDAHGGAEGAAAAESLSTRLSKFALMQQQRMQLLQQPGQAGCDKPQQGQSAGDSVVSSAAARGPTSPKRSVPLTSMAFRTPVSPLRLARAKVLVRVAGAEAEGGAGPHASSSSLSGQSGSPRLGCQQPLPGLIAAGSRPHGKVRGVVADSLGSPRMPASQPEGGWTPHAKGGSGSGSGHGQPASSSAAADSGNAGELPLLQPGVSSPLQRGVARPSPGSLEHADMAAGPSAGTRSWPASSVGMQPAQASTIDIGAGMLPTYVQRSGAGALGATPGSRQGMGLAARDGSLLHHLSLDSALTAGHAAVR